MNRLLLPLVAVVALFAICTLQPGRSAASMNCRKVLAVVYGPLPKESGIHADQYLGGFAYTTPDGRPVSLLMIHDLSLTTDPNKVRSDLRLVIHDLGLPQPTAIEIKPLPPGLY